MGSFIIWFLSLTGKVLESVMPKEKRLLSFLGLSHQVGFVSGFSGEHHSFLLRSTTGWWIFQFSSSWFCSDFRVGKKETWTVGWRELDSWLISMNLYVGFFLFWLCVIFMHMCLILVLCCISCFELNQFMVSDIGVDVYTQLLLAQYVVWLDWLSFVHEQGGHVESSLIVCLKFDFWVPVMLKFCCYWQTWTAFIWKLLVPCWILDLL